jgi:hypothetical protein
MFARRLTTLAGCLILFSAQAGLVAQDKDKEGPPATSTIDPSGRPKAFKGGEALKCAIWHDGEFWQFRTTSKKAKKGRAVIHRWVGTVRIEGDTFSGKFDKLEGSKRAENADWLIQHPDGRGFDFQLVNRGAVDELTFKVGPNAKTISFKIRIDAQKQPTYILIGKRGTNPDKADFTLPAHPKKE